MKREYAATELGIAMKAADDRRHWQTRKAEYTAKGWDHGYATGHVAALSDVLDFVLGTRDEAEQNAKLAELCRAAHVVSR